MTPYCPGDTGRPQSFPPLQVVYTDAIRERTPSGCNLYDGLGSVVGLTDSSGTVVNRSSYDPYGNTTSVSETVSNPFRYIGAIWDSQTGLYKMGERHHDPSIGRHQTPVRL